MFQSFRQAMSIYHELERKKKKNEQKQTKKKSTSLISVSPNADEGQ